MRKLSGIESPNDVQKQKLQSTKERVADLEKKVHDLKNDVTDLEKHKKLVKTQRDRIEWIENNLTEDEILVFFDFTKYNWAVHDLAFVIVYKKKDANIVSRKIIHYLHNKWSKEDGRVANDGFYAVTAMKKVRQVLESPTFKDKTIFMASDGGKHFVCGLFMDYLTHMLIEEYNRYAPHHGGNYCDLAFGICKSSLRRFEQGAGYQIHDAEEIAKILRESIMNRDSTFVVLDGISKESEYEYKSPIFPQQIRCWYCFRCQGVPHKLLFAEVHTAPEWSVQMINAKSTTYEPSQNEDVDDEEDQNMTDSPSEIQGEEDEDEEEANEHARHCCGRYCGLMIDENEGYLRCVRCDNVYHNKRECYRRSYNPAYDSTFICRDCNKF